MENVFGQSEFKRAVWALGTWPGEKSWTWTHLILCNFQFLSRDLRRLQLILKIIVSESPCAHLLIPFPEFHFMRVLRRARTNDVTAGLGRLSSQLTSEMKKKKKSVKKNGDTAARQRKVCRRLPGCYVIVELGKYYVSEQLKGKFPKSATFIRCRVWWQGCLWRKKKVFIVLIKAISMGCLISSLSSIPSLSVIVSFF